MKLYVHQTTKLVRIAIKKQLDKTMHITLCDCTTKDVIVLCKELVTKQNLSIFQSGRLTRIEIRDCTGSHNGKMTSLSFKGLSTEETYDLIVNHLTNISANEKPT